MANTRNNPLEDLAMHIPMICDRYELRDDEPPGAGEFRGGIGVVKAQRVLTPGFITHESERHTDAPWGVFGGHDGTVGKCLLYNADRPGRGRARCTRSSPGLSVEANDVMAYYSPNGGGYGSPLKRPARKVLEDVLDGFCSVEHARKVYGVVVDLEDETVDIAATEALRSRMSAADRKPGGRRHGGLLLPPISLRSPMAPPPPTGRCCTNPTRSDEDVRGKSKSKLRSTSAARSSRSRSCPRSINQRPIGACGLRLDLGRHRGDHRHLFARRNRRRGRRAARHRHPDHLLANVAIGAFMLLTADIGTEHGLPFAVYLRAPFGVHGTHLPSLSRGLVAAMWFGIQTYLGAIALNGIGEYFLGFDNWVVWYVALRPRPGRQHRLRHQGDREASPRWPRRRSSRSRSGCTTRWKASRRPRA